MPNKPVIYGPNGQPVIRVKDRLAPKPNQNAGLDGWVSWQLIDRQGRVVRGGEQHNLILDTLLNDIATNTLNGGFFATLADSLTHFAVGTDSTPPTVTDTALGAELARTTTQVAYSVARPSNGVYVFTLEREFGFGSANGNLTEFGFARGAATEMLVRELFRDGAGNPITITKTSDYLLRITYELTVTLGPVTPAAHSFVISGIGTIAGTCFLIGGTSGTDLFAGAFDIVSFSRAARGALSIGNSDWNVTPRAHNAASAVSNGYTSNINLDSPPTGGSVTPNAYTAGDFARTFDVTFGAAAANHEWQVIGLCRSANSGVTIGRPGWVFLLDSGDRFTKDNQHVLTIDEFVTYTWDRT